MTPQITIYSTPYDDIVDLFAEFIPVNKPVEDLSVYCLKSRKLVALIPAAIFCEPPSWIAVIETDKIRIGHILADLNMPLPYFTAAVAAAICRTDEECRGRVGLGTDDVMLCIQRHFKSCLALSADG